jgi:deazaflavin-dependent oxidoreductase (nitroreductase family)
MDDHGRQEAAGRRALSGTLARGGLVDITTTGRRTGEPRRIEIALHVVDGRLYISGMPSLRRRSWLANLQAQPRLILHVRDGAGADLAATARIIDTEVERRAVMPAIARAWGRTDVDEMVLHSPLIEVTLEGVGPGA